MAKARTSQEGAVISELAAGQLLSILPFRGLEVTAISGSVRSLPDVGFRNYNGTTESYGETSQQSESLKLFGGDIKVDKAIIDLEGNAARVQIKPCPRNAYGFRKHLHQRRLQQSPSEFDDTLLVFKAVLLSSSPTVVVPGSGQARRTIDNVDANGGKKYLVMSKSARRQLSRIARGNGQIEIDRNELGYQQMSLVSPYWNWIATTRTLVSSIPLLLRTSTSCLSAGPADRPAERWRERA